MSAVATKKRTLDYLAIENELRELSRSGRDNLFDIAQRVLSLFNDAENYAAAKHMPLHDVPRHLNDTYLADYNITVDEIRTILEFFPKKTDWTWDRNNSIRTLYNEALARIRSRKKASAENELPRRPPNHAVIESLHLKAKELETEKKNLSKQVEVTTKKVELLTQEKSASETRLSTVSKELETVKHTLEERSDEISRLRAENTRLQEENTRLKEENARLQGKLDVLESRRQVA